MTTRWINRSNPGNIHRASSALRLARLARAWPLALVACGTSESGAPPLDAGVPESSAGDAAGGSEAPDASGVDAREDVTVASFDAALPPVTYTNPVLAHDFPDPFVLVEGGSYYAFATNGGGKNIQAATSANLAAWSDLPDALPNLPAWAAKHAGLTWAPSVLKRGSAFVMYYTARDVASGFQCISRAVAAQPAGPYVDDSSAPFICQVSGPSALCGSIDPSPFVDTDGAAYLTWKSDENAPACNRPPRLWSAALRADGLGLAGPPAPILAMDQDWERPIIEGPSMHLREGVYFLFYSANAYESAAYAMGYATCLSPVGPCKKATLAGPFVKSAGAALGPGGQEVFRDPAGRTWMAYHAWTAPSTTYGGGGARSLRIDPLTFANGVPSLEGPSTTTQTLP